MVGGLGGLQKTMAGICLGDIQLVQINDLNAGKDILCQLTDMQQLDNTFDYRVFADGQQLSRSGNQLVLG